MMELTDEQESALSDKLMALPEEEKTQFKRMVTALALAFAAPKEKNPKLLMLVEHQNEAMVTILSAFATEFDAVELLETALACMQAEAQKDAPPKDKLN